MQRSVLGGLVVAVFAAGIAFVGGPLALESAWPLLLGAAVAFVPGSRMLGRLSAFGLGIVAGWVAFALRAGVLPDIPGGRALFLAVPVLVVTLATLVSAGRMPLWAGLAGIAGFGAAYQGVFAASPTEFATQSVATLTTVLAAAAIGAVAGMLIRPAVGGDDVGSPPAEQPPADPLAEIEETEEVSS